MWKKVFAGISAFIIGIYCAVMSFGKTVIAEAYTGEIDYGTQFEGVKTEALSGITAVLPYVLALLGVLLAIAVGMKIYRKVTGS